jgi:hypothetical protein
MMLDQLEIAENIVVITYAALMGAIALGFAVAFGLGGHDVALQMFTSACNAPRPSGSSSGTSEKARAEPDSKTTDPTIRPGGLPPPPEPV